MSEYEHLGLIYGFTLELKFRSGRHIAHITYECQ